jgi:hypothetical protein
VFRTFFGPIKSAYEKIGPAGEAALTEDLRQMLAEASRGGPRR